MTRLFTVAATLAGGALRQAVITTSSRTAQLEQVERYRFIIGILILLEVRFARAAIKRESAGMKSGERKRRIRI